MKSILLNNQYLENNLVGGVIMTRIKDCYFFNKFIKFLIIFFIFFKDFDN